MVSVLSKLNLFNLGRGKFFTLLYKKQKSLMPWIVLFSDWNYFHLNGQVSPRANQHIILICLKNKDKAEISSLLLMKWQERSNVLNYFQGSEWELPNFYSVWYAPVILTKLRNERFQIKFDCGLRFFDKILMLLWVAKFR